MTQTPSFSCFSGSRLVCTGTLAQAACALQGLAPGADAALVFDNSTGRCIDINTQGSEAQMLARLEDQYPAAFASMAKPLSNAQTTESAAGAARGRGRPKLGVVAREVTLLPRHWEWLAAQPGGASVALRKLVEQARKAHSDQDWLRQASERSYLFLQTMGGDLPGFEEASRALFAHDRERLTKLLADWPADVRKHALWLLYGDAVSESAADQKP